MKKEESTKEAAVSSFGTSVEIAEFARSNPGLKISAKLAANWGFLDGPRDQSSAQDQRNRDWGITHIKYVPDMGLNGDGVRGGL